MASPSTVLSLGFGSFGSVNLLPTLGFGSDTAEAGTPSGFWTADQRIVDAAVNKRAADWTAAQRIVDWTPIRDNG